MTEYKKRSLLNIHTWSVGHSHLRSGTQCWILEVFVIYMYTHVIRNLITFSVEFRKPFKDYSSPFTLLGTLQEQGIARLPDQIWWQYSMHGQMVDLKINSGEKCCLAQHSELIFIVADMAIYSM